MSETIALVPARGGSKRIPRKNIREFLGVPALTRVVQTLLSSGVFDRVVVSTDDDEIAEIGRSSGAEVPFIRPAALSDSFTGARPVIQHAVNTLTLPESTNLGVFYPTAVLTTRDDVTKSFSLFDGEECDFVLSVAEFPAPVERSLTVKADGYVRVREPEYIGSRSQDLPQSYHDIGQFYWGSVASWKTDLAVVQSACCAYVVDQWRAVDIDTPADWRRAELVYRMLHEQS